MHVSRRKGGKPSTHPIRGDELRGLASSTRRRPAPSCSSASGAGPSPPIASIGWSNVPGQKAKLPFQVHAHMLRHSAGYKLAGDGHDTRSIQDYLGRRDIRHTVRYTDYRAAVPVSGAINVGSARAAPNAARAIHHRRYVPGMLVALLQRPPWFGGTVKSFDATAAVAGPRRRRRKIIFERTHWRSDRRGLSMKLSVGRIYSVKD